MLYIQLANNQTYIILTKDKSQIVKYELMAKNQSLSEAEELRERLVCAVIFAPLSTHSKSSCDLPHSDSALPSQRKPPGRRKLCNFRSTLSCNSLEK